MTEGNKNTDLQNLPQSAQDFLKLVIKKMGYRKKIRAEVLDELAAHFADELRHCQTEEQKQQKAEELINQFGDPKMLAKMLRRAKKRCRPLWRKIISGTFKSVGIFILFFMVYTVFFFYGKPKVTVDYIAKLNDLARLEISQTDNAWVNYKKAADLLVERDYGLRRINKQFPNEWFIGGEYFADLTGFQKDYISQWLKLNEAAWEQFEIGASKRYCRYIYTTKGDDQERTIVHLTSPMNDLAQIGIWKSGFEFEKGNTKQALDHATTVAYAGRHNQSSIILPEQLIGSRIVASACNQILYIAGHAKLSSELLAEKQEQLSGLYAEGFPQTNMEGMRLVYLDDIQRFFTDGGIGGGHFAPRVAIQMIVASTGRRERADLGQLFKLTAGGMIHARRDETVTAVNKVCDQLEELGKMTPYMRYINNIDSDVITGKLNKYRHFLIRLVMPELDNVSKVSYQAKALHEATIAVLALQRYRSDKGQYPASLEQLVSAGYLDAVPADPYSDGPLVYKTFNDDFTLYSVSQNFTDDGGVPAENQDKDHLIIWSDQGDTVFWPVQK